MLLLQVVDQRFWLTGLSQGNLTVVPLLHLPGGDSVRQGGSSAQITSLAIDHRHAMRTRLSLPVAGSAAYFDRSRESLLDLPERVERSPFWQL